MSVINTIPKFMFGLKLSSKYINWVSTKVIFVLFRFFAFKQAIREFVESL